MLEETAASFYTVRKEEKEAWDTLYVGVSTEIINCIVKLTVIVQKNVTEMAYYAH